MATAMQTGLDWETAAAKAREVATQLQENGTKVASQTTKITQQLSETTKVQSRHCVCRYVMSHGRLMASDHQRMPCHTAKTARVQAQ